MKKPYMTPMEEEVASLYCGKKLSYQDVGEILCISPRTAESYMQKVTKRFGGGRPGDIRNIWPHLD